MLAVITTNDEVIRDAIKSEFSTAGIRTLCQRTSEDLDSTLAQEGISIISAGSDDPLATYEINDSHQAVEDCVTAHKQLEAKYGKDVVDKICGYTALLALASIAQDEITDVTKETQEYLGYVIYITKLSSSADLSTPESITKAILDFFSEYCSTIRESLAISKWDFSDIYKDLSNSTPKTMEENFSNSISENRARQQQYEREIEEMGLLPFLGKYLFGKNKK